MTDEQVQAWLDHQHRKAQAEEEYQQWCQVWHLDPEDTATMVAYEYDNNERSSTT